MKKKKLLRHQIKQGAFFLDTHFPNWELKINPNTIDLSHAELCVLGQIYGNYWDGLKKLGINSEISDILGLAAPIHKSPKLDKMWKKLIIKKLKTQLVEKLNHEKENAASSQTRSQTPEKQTYQEN